MVSPYIKLATSISELAKVIFATREEAYNRKKDREQEKAIHYARDGFNTMKEIFNLLYKNHSINDKEFTRLKTRLYKIKGKFDKYS